MEFTRKQAIEFYNANNPEPTYIFDKVRKFVEEGGHTILPSKTYKVEFKFKDGSTYSDITIASTKIEAITNCVEYVVTELEGDE